MSLITSLVRSKNTRVNLTKVILLYTVKHVLCDLQMDAAGGGFLWVVRFPPQIKLTATI